MGSQQKDEEEINATKKQENKAQNEPKSQKKQRIKVPAIKTNKVSTRNFGLGRKRRTKMSKTDKQNISPLPHPKALKICKSSPLISPKSSTSTATTHSSPSPLSLNTPTHKKSKKRRGRKKKSNDLKLPAMNKLIRIASNSSNASSQQSSKVQ